MADRDINHLHPVTRAKWLDMKARCDAAALDVRIICTWRSAAEQTALYAQGRTAPGRVVTNARAGQSKHNHCNADGTPASLAFDAAPFEKDGSINWDARRPAWKQMGALGKACGLEWAGDWVSFREYPHFQVSL